MDEQEASIDKDERKSKFKQFLSENLLKSETSATEMLVTLSEEKTYDDDGGSSAFALDALDIYMEAVNFRDWKSYSLDDKKCKAVMVMLLVFGGSVPAVAKTEYVEFHLMECFFIDYVLYFE